MKLRWCMILAAAMIGCSGSSSSESGSESASMDDLASMLDSSASPSDAAAPTDSAPQQASSASASGATAAVETARPDPNLPSKRGFGLQDTSSEIAYVLVKADADKVADAVAQQRGGTVSKDVMGKPVDSEKAQAIVFQLDGHPWSVYAAWPDEQWSTQNAELSKELGTDVITYAYSDFSGWSFVDMYRNGEEVEAFHWGLDYSDEGLPGPDLAKWDTHTTITRNYDDGISMTDQYLFRSKLRKITEKDLQAGESYVDLLFKEHDAYLPDDPEMAWWGPAGTVTSMLDPSAYLGVHAVMENN